MSDPAVSVTSAAPTVTTMVGKPEGLAVPHAIYFCSGGSRASGSYPAPQFGQGVARSVNLAPHMLQRCVCCGAGGGTAARPRALAASASAFSASAALLSSTSGLNPGNRESVTGSAMGPPLLCAVNGSGVHLDEVKPQFLRGVRAGAEYIQLRRDVLVEVHPHAPGRDDLTVVDVSALSRRVHCIIGRNRRAAWSPQWFHRGREPESLRGCAERARADHGIVAGGDRLVEGHRAERERARGDGCGAARVNREKPADRSGLNLPV